jgi:copper chaperone NosL
LIQLLVLSPTLRVAPSLFAASPRRRVPASPLSRPRVLASFLLLPFAFLLFTSCGPGRGGAVSANASYGKCPVCGMNVKESDDWTAEIFYKDQTKLLFESPGDMLAFYTSPNSYGADEAHQNLSNIERILVKDYVSKQPADARQAKFVYNSKLEGPMGPEFIPFAKREDAEAFIAANGGTLLSLDQVTSEMVREVRK